MKNIINIFRLLYVLFLCLAFLYKGYSQQQNERGGRLKGDTTVAKGITYAIIIGISNYKNVSALQYADKDAQAFENYLLSDAGGKILQENIETFLNANATRPNIGDAISILARKAKPGDRIYFFFAGHGDMEDLTQIENGLLLLYNSPNGNYFGMNDDVLEILNLKRYLSPLAQKGIEMIFIIDACHSGNLKGGVEGMQQTAAAMSAAWGKEYKILSCQPNQLSLESAEWGGGRGLFSLELEEGMKGMADQNNDGTVSMFELQSYLQANVSKYSDFKQIPLITGDLSKPFVKVNKEVLVALKKEKEENYPLIAKVNTKGNEEKYLDSLDEKGKKAYSSFLKNIESKKYIYPKDTNALADYRMLSVRFPNNPIILVMRRNLAAVLNERFNNIAEPLLKGKTSYSSREECKSAAEELDSCLHILGEQHYMYPNIKARKLFMDAMAMTWALHESEFSLGWRPTLEKSVSLLEESEKLEPNASYTQIILGEQYLFLYDYEKAFAKFQKYIELHPKDYYAKYSLATVYLKMKQFDKSEAILKELINEYPTYAQQYALLSQIYYDQNKIKESKMMVQQLLDPLKDTINYFFYTGYYFAKSQNPDSAIYYFKKAKAMDSSLSICDNNIGNMFLVYGNIDSARYYFKEALRPDSNGAFPNFNLGTIETIQSNFYNAINRFIKTIDYSTGGLEGYVSHSEIYFSKKYIVTDSSAFKEFSNKTYSYNLQYIAWLSILYCYVREKQLFEMNDKLEMIFSWLYKYREYDAVTWYHYSCVKALKNDKNEALKSIEKSIQLGFNNRLLLTSDKDLALIQDTPEFKALLKKYFPDEVKKRD